MDYENEKTPSITPLDFIYSLDIGFEFAAKANPATGKPQLSTGLTALRREGNPISIGRNDLVTGQFMTLSIYEIRARDDLSLIGSIQEMSLALEFNPAREHQAESPGVGRSFNRFRIFPYSRGHNFSTVFGQKGTLFFPMVDERAEKFCDNQLVTDDPQEHGFRAFELQNKGVFYYSMQLMVTWLGADGQKVRKEYCVDPEMVVSDGVAPGIEPCI